MCSRLLKRSVIVSQYSRTDASLLRALQKSCEKRQVSPIPGLKMSSSNSRERKALKILLRLSGDESPCPAQVCQNSDDLTPSQYQMKVFLHKHHESPDSHRLDS